MMEFQTEFSVFKIIFFSKFHAALGLFLKYSYNVANFSLDILMEIYSYKAV